MKMARLAEQQSEAETRLAAAQGTPDLTLTATYSRQYARFDDQFGLSASGTPVQLRDRDDVLTLGVQIPIGTRKRNRGNVEAACARAAAARLRREFLETRVAAEVAAALRRLSAAQSRLAILDTPRSRAIGEEPGRDPAGLSAGPVPAAGRSRRTTQSRRNQLSFIDAQTELAKSIAELERAVGGNIQ